MPHRDETDGGRGEAGSCAAPLPFWRTRHSPVGSRRGVVASARICSGWSQPGGTHSASFGLAMHFTMDAPCSARDAAVRHSTHGCSVWHSIT